MSALPPLHQWIRAARLEKGWSAAQLAARTAQTARSKGHPLSLSQQAVAYFEGGNAKSVPRWVTFARLALLDEVGDGAGEAQDSAALHDLVPIESIDLEYGLGSTFVDGHVEVEVLQFPRPWVESFTSTPSNLLTFARGRGDSMMPTIHSNDMVMIDRSQRTIAEPDAIWAYTVGDMGGIKRLRPRGGRIQILSDNPNVPPDEVAADEMRIVGRVILVIKSI
jgi:transcriptional regulator with XRE-family HTH domain